MRPPSTPLKGLRRGFGAVDRPVKTGSNCLRHCSGIAVGGNPPRYSEACIPASNICKEEGRVGPTVQEIAF